MIYPTIGRVVLIKNAEEPEAQAEPALICYVHSDTKINIGGFDHEGEPFSAEEITLLQDDDTPPETGFYAEWMPYQKEQASKIATS